MAWRVIKLVFVIVLALVFGGLWVCHKTLHVAADTVMALIDAVLDVGFDEELSVLGDDYISDK